MTSATPPTYLSSFRGVKMDADLREEILSILKTADEMTVATVRPDGYPQATTVIYVSDGFVIYFGCKADRQKVRT